MGNTSLGDGKHLSGAEDKMKRGRVKSLSSSVQISRSSQRILLGFPSEKISRLLLVLAREFISVCYSENLTLKVLSEYLLLVCRLGKTILYSLQNSCCLSLEYCETLLKG